MEIILNSKLISLAFLISIIKRLLTNFIFKIFRSLLLHFSWPWSKTPHDVNKKRVFKFSLFIEQICYFEILIIIYCRYILFLVWCLIVDFLRKPFIFYFKGTSSYSLHSFPVCWQTWIFLTIGDIKISKMIFLNLQE